MTAAPKQAARSLPWTYRVLLEQCDQVAVAAGLHRAAVSLAVSGKTSTLDLIATGAIKPSLDALEAIYRRLDRLIDARQADRFGAFLGETILDGMKERGWTFEGMSVSSAVFYVVDQLSERLAELENPPPRPPSPSASHLRVIT